MMRDSESAARTLAAAGIDVRLQAYGFSVAGEDHDHSRPFLEVACEHNGSISMSVRLGEYPAQRFFLPSFSEMAQLIVRAYGKAGLHAGRKALLAEMQALDGKYDHEGLERKSKREDAQRADRRARRSRPR